jgi:hypothetical protein
MVMNRSGFSIKAMLLATALVALTIAGLIAPSLWWGSICLSCLFATLTFALLSAVCSRRPSRAFWLGFALVGWTYAALHFAPGLDRHVGQRLIGAKILARVRPLFGPVEIPLYPSTMPAHEIALHPRGDEMFYTPAGANSIPPQWDSFQIAGHMLLAIALATAGGIAASRMSNNRTVSSDLIA